MINPAIPVTDGLRGAWIFSHRSVLDWSGNGNGLTLQAPVRWERINGVCQLRFNGANARVYSADTPTLQIAGDMSFFVAGSIREIGAKCIIAKRDAIGANYQFGFRAGGGGLFVYDGVSENNWVEPTSTFDGKRSLGAAVTSGGTVDYYLDGVYGDTGSGNITIVPHNAGFAVGNLGHSGAYYLNSPLRCALLYARKVTAEQFSLLYAWSESLISPIIPADRRYFDMRSIVPNGEGVGAWDFGIITKGESADRSGNGNHAVAEGTLPVIHSLVGRCVTTATTTDRFSVLHDASLNYTGSTTIACTLRIDTSGAIFDKGSGSPFVSMHAGNNLLWGTTAGYLKTVATFNDGLWHRFVFVYNGTPTFAGLSIYVNGVLQGVTTSGAFVGFGTTAGALKLLSRNTGVSGFIGDAASLVWDNREWSVGEISADYARFARKVIFEEDFLMARPTVANLTSGVIPGTDYEIRSGTWAVKEDANGTYAECIIAGILSRRNMQAYGTWEFGVNKAPGSILVVVIQGQAPAVVNNNVKLEITSDEKIKLGIVGVCWLFETVAGYISDSVQYTFRITRSTSGEYTAYIKGGAFGVWTLVDPTGGTGTNPVTNNVVTSSRYVLHHLGIGERLYLDRQHVGVIHP